MTAFSFHIIAGALPFVPCGPSLANQARAAVEQGLWIDYRTLQVGVEWAA